LSFSNIEQKGVVAMKNLNGPVNRRDFIKAGSLLAAATAGAPYRGSMAAVMQPAQDDEFKVSPAEDLMREHGVLNRLLLIYDEVKRKLQKGEGFPIEVLSSAAAIVKAFIEEYHEKLEEDYLFPRFEKAGKLVDLVHVLKAQHAGGRILTGRILSAVSGKTIRGSAEKQNLVMTIEQFVRMYRPHEAREDTVLFPAFRTLVPSAEYDSLGEEFEDKEHELFGKDGFEATVEKVARLEKSLGINDLSQFTPRW
jgi:hemerythrin-like domain-containing protein